MFISHNISILPTLPASYLPASYLPARLEQSASAQLCKWRNGQAAKSNFCGSARHPSVWVIAWLCHVIGVSKVSIFHFVRISELKLLRLAKTFEERFRYCSPVLFLIWGQYSPLLQLDKFASLLRNATFSVMFLLVDKLKATVIYI